MIDNILKRFNAKYYINDTGCWLWRGSDRFNYGTFYMNRKIHYAHRVSYELFVGQIPRKLMVCHSCDVKSCVNPSHLFLGTQKDNMKDYGLKGYR